MFGTMYIPYRKAYISGMNPLSFVTIFTFGELGTVFLLTAVNLGGVGNVAAELHRARPMLFWPFLGGFCWVIGDLFQQYAAKYIGIGRGIPLSNTNQLWGLAWGALVFGEMAGLSSSGKLLILTGSAIMIAGAVSISMADPGDSELVNWKFAMDRECDRMVWTLSRWPLLLRATTRTPARRTIAAGGKSWSCAPLPASSSGWPSARALKISPSICHGRSYSPSEPLRLWAWLGHCYGGEPASPRTPRLCKRIATIRRHPRKQVAPV